MGKKKKDPIINFEEYLKEQERLRLRSQLRYPVEVYKLYKKSMQENIPRNLVYRYCVERYKIKDSFFSFRKHCWVILKQVDAGLIKL